jgi:aminoglycoside/choline kinase family phosphotransferase
MDVPDDAFREEFERIAEGAVRYGVTAFMHRDMQSRNIMMNGAGPRFIDFQGGRIGPVQYDLASLLIDPYVALPELLQERLLAACADRLGRSGPIDRWNFTEGYRYCALARNLQMLGAFGFLTRVKGKHGFAPYIPVALQALSKNLAKAGAENFPDLCQLAFGLNRRSVEGKTGEKTGNNA